MYTVYILWSETLQLYYVGHTNDISRRIEEHNRGKSVFTKRGIPWKIVYREEYESRSLAAKRELEIKKRKSKRYIESLIKKIETGS